MWQRLQITTDMTKMTRNSTSTRSFVCVTASIKLKSIIFMSHQDWILLTCCCLHWLLSAVLSRISRFRRKRFIQAWCSDKLQPSSKQPYFFGTTLIFWMIGGSSFAGTAKTTKVIMYFFFVFCFFFLEILLSFIIFDKIDQIITEPVSPKRWLFLQCVQTASC